MTPMTRRLQRLLVKLEIIEPQVAIQIRRTRAGRHQLAAGAWSWYVEPLGDPGIELAGSCWTVSEVLAGQVVVDRTHPIPELIVESPATTRRIQATV